MGELLTPPIQCLLFFAPLPPRGTCKKSGTGFLCVLSEENFSIPNVVTVHFHRSTRKSSYFFGVRGGLPVGLKRYGYG